MGSVMGINVMVLLHTEPSFSTNSTKKVVVTST